ncbi:MAG: hypothetical protein PHV18_11150 [Lachnospiraceae bacterium]|nr:hypothetical protein [Lachnospiraceae bacterium]
MESRFKDLPEAVQERIKMRSNVSDELGLPQDALKKAHYLAVHIKEEWTDNQENTDVMKKWDWERSRVATCVDMIEDYVYAALQAVLKLDKTLSEATEKDRGGV